MKTILLKKALILLLTSLTIFSISACGDGSKTTLNISAAGSLTDVITEINKLYMEENDYVRLYSNFSSSGDLQTQIEQGAPVDVFLSAASRQMDKLQDKNLILPDTRRDILTNSVALIVPAGSTLNLDSFAALSSKNINRIAIGDPEFVPAGSYGKQVLEMLGIYEDVSNKFIIAGNVMQVRSYVESGEADAGILFLTDANISEKVRVTAVAPDEINKKIVYPAAVVTESDNVKAATDYLDFLSSPKAKSIFEKYGFTVIE